MTAYEAETLAQMREISSLRARVKALESENDELRQRLTRLEKQLSEALYAAQAYSDKYWSKCDW